METPASALAGPGLPPTLVAWMDAERARLAPAWRHRLRNRRLAAEGGEPPASEVDALDVAAAEMTGLLAHGRTEQAWRFLNAWLDGSGDHAGLPLLRFYLIRHALARSDALALAQRLAAPGAPRLLLTQGLPGSGKSLVASLLAQAAEAVCVHADVERKRQFGAVAADQPAEPVPGGIDGPCATARTYDELLQRASHALRGGWPVIVDAAFLRRCERDRFHALAFDLQLPFQLLACEAPEAVLRERVGARGLQAEVELLDAQREAFEPLAEDEMRNAIVLRTDRPWDAAALAARWAALSGQGLLATAGRP